LSDDFTTTNIYHKLVKIEGRPYFDNDFVHNDTYLTNNVELYKYSVFPSPDDFNRYFYNDGDKGLSDRKAIIKEVFDEKDDGDAFKSFFKSALDSTNMELVDQRAKMAFHIKYMAVSLDKLFKILPGHYINVVCRSTTDTMLWDSRKSNVVPNPTPQREHTREEIVRRILPHMNLNSRINLVTNLGVEHPNINSRSSKKLSINLLPSTRKSIVHNELKKTYIPFSERITIDRPKRPPRPPPHRKINNSVENRRSKNQANANYKKLIRNMSKKYNSKKALRKMLREIKENNPNY